jgi:hypothetical protein
LEVVMSSSSSARLDVWLLSERDISK